MSGMADEMNAVSEKSLPVTVTEMESERVD